MVIKGNRVVTKAVVLFPGLSLAESLGMQALATGERQARTSIMCPANNWISS